MLSDLAPLTDSERPSLVRSALRLSYFTVAWNGVVGATALAIGLTTGSLALAGFALNALLIHPPRPRSCGDFGRNEAIQSQRKTSNAEPRHGSSPRCSTVAIYISFQALRALINGAHPESSAFGLGIAAISMLVLPVLGVLKLRLAGHLGSPALRGDGVLTLAAAALAAITLIALLANSVTRLVVGRPRSRAT